MKSESARGGHVRSKESSVEKKRQQWQNKLDEILRPDVYGYVIDKGVRETVAALQLLGFNTTQSDQGNYSETPWIQVDSGMPKDIYIGEQELKTELMTKTGISPDEIDEKFPSFDRSKQVDIEEGAREQLAKAGAAYTPEYQEWHRRSNELAHKLQNLVDEFYAAETTPEGAKDLRVSVEFPYRAPQYNAYIQDTPSLRVNFVDDGVNVDTLSEEERKEASARALREMTRFTEFLKERFLNSKI